MKPEDLLRIVRISMPNFIKQDQVGVYPLGIPKGKINYIRPIFQAPIKEETNIKYKKIPTNISDWSTYYDL